VFANEQQYRATAMRRTNREVFFLRAILGGAWSALMVRPRRSAIPPSGVIIHDPEASKPKDLDDPFIDPKVQERIGKMIASSARRH
jgi:hypothetical protein